MALKVLLTPSTAKVPAIPGRMFSKKGLKNLLRSGSCLKAHVISVIEFYSTAIIPWQFHMPASLLTLLRLPISAQQ